MSGQPSPNIRYRRYWHWSVTRTAIHPQQPDSETTADTMSELPPTMWLTDLHERVFGNKASVNNFILR